MSKFNLYSGRRLCWIAYYKVWLPVFVYLWKMEAGSLCVKVSITGRKRELMTRSCVLECYVTISIFGYVAPDYEAFIKQKVFKIWLYICLNYPRTQNKSTLHHLCFRPVWYCPILHDCPENGTIFGRKCFFFLMQRFLIFSATFVWNFYKPRRLQWSMNWICLPVIFFLNFVPTWILSTLASNIDCHENPTHDEANSLFSQLRERARKKEVAASVITVMRPMYYK